MNCLTLIFSKDRALQLDATLRSFLLHCGDAKSFQTRVMYTTSAPLHAGQYETLIREYDRYDFIRFLHEQDFRSDVIALLAPFDYILFLVDDNIVVRNFRLAEVLEHLRKNSDAIGVSLRLGRNTTYCYTLDKKQRLPEFHAIGNSILKYPWPDAEYDFGYPLEISSSVYRTEDIIPFFAGLQFKNPNTLEGMMNVHKNIFKKEKPFLLCFEQSVTFSVPLNMVQTMWQNRTSGKSEYSPDRLAELFDKGHRIDVHSYSNFSPAACHQEVDLKFVESPKVSPDRTQPLISVIIPCYNQAQYLPEAVESIVNQTYQNWECIIVNDGSPDNTSEVARDLIAKYPGCNIRLLEKPNTGLADARNTGIREAKGTWILPLDSDDMFAPHYLERAVRIIQGNPSVNIVTTNEQAFGAMPHEWIPNEYTRQRILNENTFIYASLYKKELWEAVGGYYPGIPWGAEDWNFWIACSKAGIVHKCIPEKLFLYRTHAGTSMRDIMKKHWSEVVAMIRTLHPGLYPGDRLASDHGIIASAHPDTVARLDSLISRFPDLSMPYFWRGLIHERSGNLDLAQMNYEKSLSLSGKDNWQQQLRLIQVKAFSSVSRLKNSIPVQEHLLPVSQLKVFLDQPQVPESVKSLFEQADEYFLKGDLVQARDTASKALNILPNDPCLIIAHGSILLCQGLVEAARKEFLRAKILDPESAFANFGIDALMTLAECYAAMGDHKNAVSLYERVIEISDNPESFFENLSDPEDTSVSESRSPCIVSVIVPCYKQAHFLPNAVESVVQQTFDDWECIIVNDGSPDNTTEVVQDLIAKHPDKKIILLEKKNGGLADARNFGIKHSMGKYILPLDADDGIHPEMLSKTVSLLESNPGITVAYTHAVHVTETMDIEKIRAFPEYDPRNILIINCFSYCSLYRREVWEAAGGYNTSMTWGYEDWDFWVACLEKGILRPKCIPEPLFFYRVKDSSMIKQAVGHDAELKAKLIMNHPGLYNPAQIAWAKGILAGDADILAIPHSEGSIPGFFDPLPDKLFAAKPIHHESFSGQSQKNEKDQPLVSVVIPCYNQAQYLPDAVESVVNQTYQNWECIIVNDGSPDNTTSVAKELISRYPDKKIILLEKENGGLSDARNFGIKHARGEYILPLDSDDLIHPRMLQKTVDLLNSNPDVAIAYTDAVYSGKEKKIVRSEEYDLEKVCVHNRFNYCSLYRRKAWEDAGGYSTNMVLGYEDWDFWIACAEKGFYGKRIPEPLFIYRVKESSMYTKAREHDDELKARIVSNHPGLYDEKTNQWAKKVLENKKTPQQMKSPQHEKDHPAVIPSLETVTKLYPAQQIMAFINQADVHIANNNPASARESIRQALNYATGNDRLISILSNILNNLGDPESASKFLKNNEKD